MPRNTVYLEAPDRTQDLLNIKWALLSAGYTIGSTWHDSDPGRSSRGFVDHWSARRLEQLRLCDSLVVVVGKNGSSDLEALVAEVGVMAGFALARCLRVIWIGTPVRGLFDFRAVQQFDTPEDFRRQILLQQTDSQPVLTAERLAA